MISYKSFYEFLFKNKLITNIWKYILELVEEQINENSNKEYFLIIFTIYFSLINDGNIGISLDKDVLKNKWFTKINGNKVALIDSENYQEAEFDQFEEVVTNVIDNYLALINQENLPTIIGNNKIFQIDDGYLYLKKYNFSRKGIVKNIQRLFANKRDLSKGLDYTEFVNSSKITPTAGQIKAFEKGLSQNLIITGGPGTGKTTSILFLLINLFKANQNDLQVYLVAPSGKAASRMKDSIINGLGNIDEDFKTNNPEIFTKISQLEGSTIHRLLEHDSDSNGFLYNKKHQFVNNSLFVIDEASMIDICLFNDLLEAIPDSAYLYIMGDRDQLPSVECGAVFGELLKLESLKDNIVELDVSKRFSSKTKIYQLAKIINNGEELTTTDDDWQDIDSFEIQAADESKPIFYYNIEKVGKTKKEVVEHIIKKWSERFYADLQAIATNLNPNNYEQLNNVFQHTEISKILCAENKGISGITNINKYIVSHFIDYTKPSSIRGYYPGMIMMINKNNKMLDLYNGDMGIIVSFINDPILYFMVKQNTRLVKEDGKVDDEIFKIKNYVFFPLRMIVKDDIDLAYAITIHKSQGSDYNNILVILPSSKGHPLLNRQIVYTAITRTKGNTYILANNERLKEAKDYVIIRDTNIS